MSIPAIEGVSLSGAGGVSPTGYLSSPDVIGRPEGASGVSGTSSAFGEVLTGAVGNLQSLQEKSNALAVRAVTGDLDDIHDYTIASSEAKLTLELTAAVRNKAVEAFSEIMRMQA
ncbi:flagellar hook-basal body protein [Sanguibacter keddieii DSM 10542]|uniref:Flagellar hook-basal body complex protein FliE n=1 Tax=Sanguibacter keddieii (strain ATCC 51767 / DSM 10542 / NCFB 3025 / ST-74) TaxID=446469 RepID=D1BD16_SANKS|nr:flagellar hook-basal body complex protein FliE [Sanguibacter keddieii]ACZ23020.1 flagellar hook-basal body protein [Sanguibacter keddieii DSM 10542]